MIDRKLIFKIKINMIILFLILIVQFY